MLPKVLSFSWSQMMYNSNIRFLNNNKSLLIHADSAYTLAPLQWSGLFGLTKWKTKAVSPLICGSLSFVLKYPKKSRGKSMIDHNNNISHFILYDLTFQ